MRLKKCFPNKNKVEIPHNISEDETIIRAVFHPIFFSSKKGLKPQAFLPNPRTDDAEQRKRVSVYRKNYSTDSACKNSAVSIKMNQQSYVGFAAFIAMHISNINQLNEMTIQARVSFTPMDAANRYTELANKRIYTSDKGTPMHAEIMYNKEIEMDNPNTGHRLYADKLIEITKNSVYIDKEPLVANWHQEEIKWKSV